jgi:cystathionine beta-synthase
MNLIETIGNTPLVELFSIQTNPNVTLLAKLEFLNPSGSIKDRIVRFIIEEAELNGKLTRGSTIVENTSGNTGAAVAMIASIKGYHAILTMPDKVSIEKQNALRAYGAEVVICPTGVRPDSPEHYVNKAKQLAAEIPGAFRLDQYDNPLNPQAHYRTTGPEIWQQCSGSIDIFVASGSTGGTVSGCGRYLKEKKKSLQVVMPDPFGSIYYDYFRTGKIPQGGSCNYHVEGIGEDHIAKAMDFSIIDRMLQFTDQEAFGMARQLAEKEGLLVGGSAGANVWAALELAKEITKPTTIVTVIPDGGIKYLSKIYNDHWLEQANIDLTKTSHTVNSQ